MFFLAEPFLFCHNGLLRNVPPLVDVRHHCSPNFQINFRFPQTVWNFLRHALMNYGTKFSFEGIFQEKLVNFTKLPLVMFQMQGVRILWKPIHWERDGYNGSDINSWKIVSLYWLKKLWKRSKYPPIKQRSYIFVSTNLVKKYFFVVEKRLWGPNEMVSPDLTRGS